MKMRSQILVLAIVAIIAGSAALNAQSDRQEKTGRAPAKTKVYKFRSADYPGGTLSTVLDYEGGIAVGGTSFGSEPEIGFAYRGTTNSVIAYPGSISSEASGVNASGHIVGAFADQNGVVHGFLYDGKTYATIDPPGSTYTCTLGINAAGEIVGYYSVNYVSHGFLLSNGSFIEIDFPSMPATTVTGINDKGAIAGSYLDFNNVSHGFTLIDGTFTTVDVPEAQQTYLKRISNNGNVAGYLQDAYYQLHGIIGE